MGKSKLFHYLNVSLYLFSLAYQFASTDTPVVLRQTCAAYMASYIARAKFVSLETAKLSLSIMVQWIHE